MLQHMINKDDDVDEDDIDTITADKNYDENGDDGNDKSISYPFENCL